MLSTLAAPSRLIATEKLHRVRLDLVYSIYKSKATIGSMVGIHYALVALVDLYPAIFSTA